MWTHRWWCQVRVLMLGRDLKIYSFDPQEKTPGPWCFRCPGKGCIKYAKPLRRGAASMGGRGKIPLRVWWSVQNEGIDPNVRPKSIIHTYVYIYIYIVSFLNLMVIPNKAPSSFWFETCLTGYQGISRQNIPGWSELWCPSALMLAFVTKKKGAVPLKSSHLPSTQSGCLSLFCLPGRMRVDVYIYIYTLYLYMKCTYISWHVDFCSLILTPCWGSKREPRGLQWSNEEKMVTQPPGGDKKHHSEGGWKQHDTMICRDVWRATEVSRWQTSGIFSVWNCARSESEINLCWRNDLPPLNSAWNWSQSELWEEHLPPFSRSTYHHDFGRIYGIYLSNFNISRFPRLLWHLLNTCSPGPISCKPFARNIAGLGKCNWWSHISLGDDFLLIQSNWMAYEMWMLP